MDTGYYYGYGLFETILIHKGKAILIEQHLKRLKDSLAVLGIKQSVTTEDVTSAMAQLECQDGVLKINVSENNIVYTTRSSQYTEKHYSRGLRLHVSDLTRNPKSLSVYMKTMNYLDNIYEWRKAKEEGWDDVLFMNVSDEVCETAVANIYFIKGGRIITPKVSAGLLNGVIRHWLVDEVDVVEALVPSSEIKKMDAAFVSNSVLGVMKVAAIGDHEFKDHPLIHTLMAKYKTMLEKDHLHL